MVYFLCKASDSGRQNCYFALSLPVRGVWVEMPSAQMRLRYSCVSLPVRGVWVEIRTAETRTWRGTGRSPCGECGLKSSDSVRLSTMQASLPVRGVWVEIGYARTAMFRRRVAPRAGSVG